MRFVIYDDETVEPITVVSVRGLTERCIEALPGHTLRLAPLPRITALHEPMPIKFTREIVTVRFERFRRGSVEAWMAFTREADLAMLLEPDFLPGQRREVNRLRDEADSLARLIGHALGI